MSNSKHVHRISVFTQSLYASLSSFNDSFILYNVETHVQEIINEGTTRRYDTNYAVKCVGGRFLVTCLLGLSSYHFFIKSVGQV